MQWAHCAPKLPDVVSETAEQLSPCHHPHRKHICILRCVGTVAPAQQSAPVGLGGGREWQSLACVWGLRELLLSLSCFSLNMKSSLSLSLCFLPIFPLLIPHHLFPPLGLLFLVLLDILFSLPHTTWGFLLPMGEARLSPAPPPTLPLVTELELVLFIPSSISSWRYRCWQSTWSCHFCLVLRRESYHVSLVHEMNLISRECHASSWRL